jgi:hypothetical protein
MSMAIALPGGAIRNEAQTLLDQLERWDFAPDQPFLPIFESLRSPDAGTLRH